MEVGALLAGAVLTATLAMVLVRPWDMGEVWWAGTGGGLSVVLGLVPLREVGEILIETSDALVLLAGMMALSGVAEKAGFFEWAAALAARAGGGRVIVLYGMVFLAGTLITATLSLDATVIVFTPIVYGMVARLRLSPLPFMFACVYAANTASLFLPVSNLTNLLVYNAFDLGFLRFGLIMLLPAVLAVTVNVLLFAGIFHHDLRGSYNQKLSFGAPDNRAFFRLGAGGIALTLAALFVAPVFGIPIGGAALVVGLIVVAVARARGWMRLREAAGSVSWGIIVLVVGLFVVVRGAQNAGFSTLVQDAFGLVASGEGFVGMLGVAAGSALGSNLINNVPMTVAALGALEPLVSDGTLGPATAYAVLIGTNVGPNLTTVGSLATLIWLAIVRDKGLEITARDYLKIGALSTPLILLSAVAGLWVSHSTCSVAEGFTGQ